jgi:hypothetical protein
MGENILFSPWVRIKSYKPHKPDSVSIPSFILLDHYWANLAAYPGSWASSPQAILYMALQYLRFTQVHCYQQTS